MQLRRTPLLVLLALPFVLPCGGLLRLAAAQEEPAPPAAEEAAPDAADSAADDAADQPAAEPAPQPAPAPVPRVDSAFLRLLHPEMASQLRLDDEQQAQIKQIFAERDAALAQAPAEDHAAVAADADERIAQVLTSDQRNHLVTIERDEQRRLRFSFRYQPWADVLNWFAEQSDLSLVLDAPPPGTFNYSDTREYTVPEAIDQLNRVLLTKGYTLLRGERMLMLIDLQGGLPVDLIPRVSVGELKRRGKYELVSVTFPIGDRSPDEVQSEIQPLIGAHGKVAVLPKTKQVLVTDTAGKMAGIQAVIEGIPEPSRERSRRPDERPRPDLAVFPLSGLEPKPTIEILSALVPGPALVHDTGANQLLAQVTGEQKGAIEKILSQIRADRADGAGPQLRRHPVRRPSRGERGDRGDFFGMFRAVAPDAVFRYDFENSELIVWAPADQQERIRELLGNMGQSGTSGEQRQLEVYTVNEADPATLLEVLERMLPEVRFAIDTANRTILALASPDDHQAIKSTIEQVARQGDNASLKVHALTPQQRKRAQTILAGMERELPGVRIVPDENSGDLSIWATDEQHQRVARIIEQVTTATSDSDSFEVTAYHISAADLSSVTDVLQTLFPDTKFITDAKGKQIVAWATPADQEKIRRTIEQLDGEAPEARQLQLMSHPVGQAAPDTLITMLATILPDVQVVNDVKNSAIVAWARTRDHEVIRRAIEQAQPNTPEEQRSRVEVYAVGNADPIQVAYMLTTVYPTGRFTGDRAAMKLVAWATPEEHESIKATVQGLLDSEIPGQERKFAVYQAVDTDATTLLTVLQSAVPDGRFTADARNGSVIAFARPDQHNVLQQAVEELRRNDASDNKRTAKVYRFHTGDARTAYQVLRYIVPGANLAIDNRTGSLAATATPAEHKQIAAMVDELEGHGGIADELELQVYDIRSTEPTAMMRLLRDLFSERPETRISVDGDSGKLVAWALPSQHALIRDIISRVDDEANSVDDRQIEVYPLGDANPDSVARTLSTMFERDRNVRIMPDDGGGFITIWGNAQVQASAKAVIEQMQGHKENIAVIPLDIVDPFTAQSTIERLFGDRRGRDRAGVPRVDIDPDGRQLLVRATKEQLQQIRNMLTEMGEPAADLTASRTGSDSRTRVIPISDRNLRAALEEISRVWPNLRDNPIRVVTPSAVAPTVRADRTEREGQSEPQPADADQATERRGPLPAQKENNSNAENNADDNDECQQDDELNQDVEEDARNDSPSDSHEVDEADESDAEFPPAPRSRPLAPGTLNDDFDPRELDPRDDDDEPEFRPQGTSPAIVIAPSGDSITISSDDVEALDQFEQLLKSFVKRSSSGGREFAIFYLKRANAANVADTIQNVVMGGGFGFRGYGASSVVPDQRLNAVIVQASRNEMELIDGLIQTLDSDEAPQSPIGQRPKLIPVRNTNAERIAEIVREVYKTRLTAGGARQQMQLPQRMPREMAALLQQLNAATTGPEMTLGVDPTTNSLVVAAPPQLLAEVEELVQTLDEQSNASKPTVRVMPLKQISTQALEQALGNIIGDSPTPRRRRMR